MDPELPLHLDLDLPSGPVLSFPNEPLPPEVLFAWRQRTYLEALRQDPDLARRWIPKVKAFSLD